MTANSVQTWYPTLNKPSWNPPNWLFAPVWTALYIMMAVSVWLVWREGQFTGVPAALFALQLLLNVAWSWLFFARHRPDLAFGEIVLLWLAILATSLSFRPVSSTAFALLIPYLLWVTFASYLNWTIWRLNRTG